MITDADMPEGYRLEEANAAALVIVDAEQPDLRLSADLLEHGVLIFYVQTEFEVSKRRGVVRGSALFDLMMRHFGTGIRTIRLCWTSGTNYKLFRELLSEGATIHEAASNTWTAQQAQRHGFVAVVIRRMDFIPRPDSAMVDFLRGRNSE